MSGSAKSGIFQLHKAQLAAVHPSSQIWLSASAGTGKTQVLSARALRLLLTKGVRPENILCLTFTKAGATEMAARVQRVLASWVRASATDLARDLSSIGADPTPEIQERARRLFASVLDAPGGGLHIQTIHSFCQSLLAAFPLEAEIAPGFRPLEDREKKQLARQALISMLVEAERNGDTGLIDRVSRLSMRMGDEGAQAFMARAADAYDLWFGDGAWTGDIKPRLLMALGLPLSMDRNTLVALCDDSAIDRDAFEACATIARQWSAKTGQELAGAIEQWLHLAPEERFDQRTDLRSKIATQAWEPKGLKNLLKQDPSYGEYAERAIASLKHIADQESLLEYADYAAGALTVGRAFAFQYRDAKQAHGYLDHDDQIRLVAKMLGTGSMAGWISYKLDQRFDHILVDESQDTNAAQWSIARHLTSDFYSGEGAKGDEARTLFTVGDYKQAIYGFQGTSPVNYEAARILFKDSIEAASETLNEPVLDINYRSSQTLLNAVDWTIEDLGKDAFGLTDTPSRHFGAERPGSLMIWRAVGLLDEEAAVEEDEGSGDEDGWLSKPDRKLADTLAQQIAEWLKQGLVLEKTGKPVRPGDIMILVRSRKDLASLIISRLYTHGVPVAGLDRLRLGQPLAVQDLLAAMAFAVQPHDELNLANLLVSPLMGLDQQQLLDVCWREFGADGKSRAPLWPHLRQKMAGTTELEKLAAILARADFDTPYAFLEWILSGPLQGRRRLLERLGEEANDPIDELLATALNYQSEHGTGLQKFLDWFGQDDEEIKRETGEGTDLVRVMTVHGSKGLQAPIVILADATSDPNRAQRKNFSLSASDGLNVPLPRPLKPQMVGPLLEADEAIKQNEAQEHWRLLYVAMTRAEERLCIAGTAQGPKRQIPDSSWYAAVAATVDTRSENGWQDSALWGGELVHGAPLRFDGPAERLKSGEAGIAIPEWAKNAVAPEPRPPRPLAPSDPGEDDALYPPGLQSDGRGIAARRGILLHALFERLPAVTPLQRRQSGLVWLERQAPGLSLEAREALLESALKIIDHPEYGEVFGPNSLAEVPVAALVGDSMMNGVIDRLILTPDNVTIVDFKSTRAVPGGLADIPRSYVRQMASYAAALRQIYPDRTISAALLYTEAPKWITLPNEMLAQ